MYKKAFEKLKNFGIEYYLDYIIKNFNQDEYFLRRINKKTNNIFIFECYKLVWNYHFVTMAYIVIVKERDFYYRYRETFDNVSDAIEALPKITKKLNCCEFEMDIE